MAIKKLYFGTTNEGKLAEARALLDMEIEGSGLTIDEIQSLDEGEVATKKGLAYFEKLKKPIVVEDNSLTFQALNGLPGTYINDFSKVLGNEGLIKLIAGSTDRCATAKTTLVYVDKAGVTHTFFGEIHGDIVTEPRGDKGFGWDPIFQPYGSEKTYAEMDMDEKNKYSMRAQAFAKLKEFLAQQED